MNAKQYVTDTHSLVWYFTENPRLSRKALKVFEKTEKEGTIIIPAVVLAEMMYIAKKGRITMSFADTVKKIEDSENFEITPLKRIGKADIPQEAFLAALELEE